MSCTRDDSVVVDEGEEKQPSADVFNMEKLPQIHLAFSVEEWNKLLAYYDEDKDNKNFVRCNILYEDEEESYEISEIGARIRGAWSRRRPEGDTKPAYYGVYQMMEHINKQYLKDRINVFGDSKGNLWKCGKEASLTPAQIFFFSLMITVRLNTIMN